MLFSRRCSAVGSGPKPFNERGGDACTLDDHGAACRLRCRPGRVRARPATHYGPTWHPWCWPRAPDARSDRTRPLMASRIQDTDGSSVRRPDPTTRGVGFIPNDRIKYGIFTNLSIHDNIAAGIIRAERRIRPFRVRRREAGVVRRVRRGGSRSRRAAQTR